MGSAALVAAVPYPGGCCALPKFAARNNEVISIRYHIIGVIVCPQSGELLRIMQGETVGSTNLHLACNDRLLVGAINADLEANQSSVPKGVHNYMLQVTQGSFDIHCLLHMSFLWRNFRTKEPSVVNCCFMPLSNISVFWPQKQTEWQKIAFKCFFYFWHLQHMPSSQVIIMTKKQSILLCSITQARVSTPCFTRSTKCMQKNSKIGPKKRRQNWNQLL